MSASSPALGSEGTTSARLSALVGMGRAREAVERIARAAAGDGGQVQSVLLYGPLRQEPVALAHILSQGWLCTDPQPDGACGVCQSCLAAIAERHVDLLVVEPQPPSFLIRLGAVTSGKTSGSERSKAGTELSIQEFLRTFPMMGRNKVVMIVDAHRMNSDAANAFLKTLEEPPERARIVLTARSPSQLLPTVVSRCLALACELPTVEEFASTSEAWGELAVFLERSPERSRELEGKEEVYRGILRLAQDLQRAKSEEVLSLSERLRGLAEELDKKSGSGMRIAQAEVLASLGIALNSLGGLGLVPAVAEAHRRILGNASAGLLFDALVGKLLA